MYNELSPNAKPAKKTGLGALVCAAAGLLAGVLPAAAAENAAPIKVSATAILGEGTAELTGSNNLYQVRATATTLGDYAENWRFPGTVIDLRFPTPQELPAGTNRLSVEVKNPYHKDKPDAGFRILIGDARGGEWAVSTFLKGKRGDLPYVNDFERELSFPVDITEAGRIDRWVMMALDPQKFDEYALPQPPLKLLGVRLILKEKGELNFSFRNLQPEMAGSGYDPCWDLMDNPIWTARLKLRQPRRFGWGQDEAAPYLKPSDLSLGKGKFDFTWEITDLATQKQTHTASGSAVIDDNTPAALSFPLLPAGTYRLNLYLKPENEKAGREMMFHYVVYSNSRGFVLPARLAPKPLNCATAGSSTFAPGAEAKAQLAANGAQPGDTIEWALTSADQRALGTGSIGATGGAIDLAPFFAAGENTVWLEAKLMRGGVQIDVLRRVFGQTSSAPAVSATPPAPGAKEKQLAGQFQRTKGDWHEGGTAVISQHKDFMEKFTKWTDEAKEIGYNIVEYSVPWDEAEPLPGVYEFKYIDEMVKIAKDRGLYVVLRVHPNVGCVPDWLPRETQRASDGRWHGIWGGSSNPIYDPASDVLNSAQAKFLETLAAHYRDDQKVIGYTLSNVFFDHGFIDSPYTGQYSGYSEAMRLAFIEYLRAKYATLSAVNKAHGASYTSWESIPLPGPVFTNTADGRLQPRQDRLHLDFMDCKKKALMAFRTRAIEAMRKGDPSCMVGPYSDNARALLEDYYEKNDVMVAQGSMEDQYPPLVQPYQVRYEPHAKVSRLARTTDIGVSNLLFYQPGRNTFFNYWFPQWTLATVEPDIKEAEARLKTWFASVDRLMGAQPLGVDNKQAEGMVVASLDTLLNNWQHLHTARINDYLAPYFYRCKNEMTRSKMVFSTEAGAKLAHVPYVYVPYSSDEIDAALARKIADFVQNGGRLFIDGTGGNWTEDGVTAGSLRTLLALPAVRILPQPQTEAEKAEVSGGMLKDQTLSFRTRQWLPPIESQPVAWIDTCARGYYLPARFTGALPEGAETLATIGGEPVALRIPFGKGEVIAFAGTVDWFGSIGLAGRLDNWGKGLALDTPRVADPEALVSAFSKDDKVYAIGRRFIRHDLIAKLKGGKMPQGIDTPQELALKIPGMPAGKWKVSELLSGKDYAVAESAEIVNNGIKLPLHPGEAFFLELTKQ